ncbi:MAG: peptidylprolyl isomerase [Sedimentisphaerales bacterium]|nr:peptidylprolyl isomerase [Sedimentisphaerales bacterium]
MKKLIILSILICTAPSLQADTIVTMETNLGNITLELYPEAAPITVGNFLGYVESGFYNGLLFHRAVNSGISVIQGGGYYFDDPNICFAPPTQPDIINESYNGLSNLRGTIAMARTYEPNSANSQFYINQLDNTILDQANYPDGFGHCVFGSVLQGMDVVDVIAQVPTCDLYPLSNIPCDPMVVICDVYIVPEPATVLLLTLGTLILTKKK